MRTVSRCLSVEGRGRGELIIATVPRSLKRSGSELEGCYLSLALDRRHCSIVRVYSFYSARLLEVVSRRVVGNVSHRILRASHSMMVCLLDVVSLGIHFLNYVAKPVQTICIHVPPTDCMHSI